MAKRSDSLTDEDLLANLKQDKNVDDTIRFLYRTHFEMLSRYVMQNSGKAEDAEDVFQEVVIAFINLVKAGKFRGESTVRTFLFSLNKNIWLNELKKRNRSQARDQKFELESQKETGIAWVIEHREANAELMRSIEQLGENCKKILLLYYFENFSMKEILTTLHYENEQVVRNKKYKCLKKLEEFVHQNQNLYRQLKSFLHD